MGLEPTASTLGRLHSAIELRLQNQNQSKRQLGSNGLPLCVRSSWNVLGAGFPSRISRRRLCNARWYILHACLSLTIPAHTPESWSR